MINNKEILFAKIHCDAKIPSKRVGDGGYDIYACFDEQYIEIPPFSSKLIPTNISSAFSDDYVFLLRERGSTGVKNMKINAGVIDASFRGGWFVSIYNGNEVPIIISKEKWVEDNFIYYPYEKAIAQALLVTVPKVEIKEIDCITLANIPSERADGMIGSSGK